jgi:16S rRNA (uracil1498-N3)-methyltransferase
MIRLFVPDRLADGALVALADGQAHYLRDVMRQRAGGEVLLFNGRDGEWRATIATAERRAVSLSVAAPTRPQVVLPDLELIVALVKRARLETIVEKATELGASRIRLAVTRFTQAERTNVERLTAIAIEAAEQTGRLDVPEIVAPAKLDAILNGWPAERPLIFCDEAGDAPNMADALFLSRHPPPQRSGVRGTHEHGESSVIMGGPNKSGHDDESAVAGEEVRTAGSILIGPEGGFSADERARIRALANVTPVSLGPRILRADTAAIAALSLWQSIAGDWRS